MEHLGIESWKLYFLFKVGSSNIKNSDKWNRFIWMCSNNTSRVFDGVYVVHIDYTLVDNSKHQIVIVFISIQFFQFQTNKLFVGISSTTSIYDSFRNSQIINYFERLDLGCFLFQCSSVWHYYYYNLLCGYH